MQNKDKHLIVLAGATASGKTALAVELALQLNCSVLSADSRQFYKELSIGTAKPSVEEMKGVRHYFINNLSIREEYTAGQFETDALRVLEDEFKEKDVAILTGGSGLYIDALCKGIDDLPRSKEIRQHLIRAFEKEGIHPLQEELKACDPESAAILDLQNPHRVMRALEVFRSSGKKMSELQSKQDKERPFSVHYFAIHHPREQLYDRINQRVTEMIQNGLVDEVKSVENFRNHQALNTVGYKEIFDYLDGQLSLDEAADVIRQNTRRYAKRQLTWFRREASTKWIDYAAPKDNAIEIIRLLSPLLDH